LFAEDIAIAPFLEAGRPNDMNNIGPRVGLAFKLTDRTVLRGGIGKYFAEVTDQISWGTVQAAKVFTVQVFNDGRPDFASNPFNGPAPTFEQAISEWKAGRQQRSVSVADPTNQVPYSYQASAGFQRQLGDVMAFEADYVFNAARHETALSRSINLTFDPVTGVNYPFTDVSRRAYPEWSTVSLRSTYLFNDYHALQTGFTKRMSHRWQASGTYTLDRVWRGDPLPINPVENCRYPMVAPGKCDVPFTVAPDLGGHSYWEGMGHRAVLNGIWDMGYSVQLSGLYFYHNGMRTQSTYGGDLRRQGTGATNRLRPDGSIVPRNNFKEKSLHRLDVRLQRRVGLGGSRELDAMFEVFNLFNRANYGTYVTQEVSPAYGNPSFNANIAYQPRIVQLGLRFAF
jgi:hypothetical protein